MVMCGTRLVFGSSTFAGVFALVLAAFAGGVEVTPALAGSVFPIGIVSKNDPALNPLLLNSSSKVYLTSADVNCCTVVKFDAVPEFERDSHSVR